MTNLDTLSTAADSTIDQTEIAYLKFPVKVPNGLPPGPYVERFNLVQEGLVWLPDLGIHFNFNVNGP